MQCVEAPRRRQKTHILKEVNPAQLVIGCALKVADAKIYQPRSMRVLHGRQFARKLFEAR